MLSAPSEQVLTIVARVLTPYLGVIMANASARGVCDKLGFRATQLERPQMEQLVDALVPGLNVFIGQDKRRLVVEEIWRALDALGGTP